jgi:hypothetical protein
MKPVPGDDVPVEANTAVEVGTVGKIMSNEIVKGNVKFCNDVLGGIKSGPLVAL